MSEETENDNEKPNPLVIMQQARDLLTEAKAALANIKNYEKELLEDTEERNSVRTKISNLDDNISTIFTTAEENKEKTDSFYTELLGHPDTPDDSIISEIKKAKQEALDMASKTKSICSSLEDADIKVNGYSNPEDETKNIEGLIDKTKNVIKTNEEFHGTQVDDNKVLLDRINNLLSGATTVSLAKAYEDQQKKYKWPNILWSIVFLLSMIVMVVFAIDTFNNFIFKDASDAFIKIVSRSPLFLPLIWIGIFASKQQSQNKRLEQEYAHKASIAKSFEGYKEQIEKLINTNEDGQVTKDLLNNVIEAIKNNPSDTLESKSHTDGVPMKPPSVIKT